MFVGQVQLVVGRNHTASNPIITTVNPHKVDLFAPSHGATEDLLVSIGKNHAVSDGFTVSTALSPVAVAVAGLAAGARDVRVRTPH